MTLGPNPNDPLHRTAAQLGKTNFARLTKTGHDWREAAPPQLANTTTTHEKLAANPQGRQQRHLKPNLANWRRRHWPNPIA